MCSRLKIHKTQPVSLAKFCHFLITSCSHEKDTRLSPLYPYWKQRKAGRGLGMRLLFPPLSQGLSSVAFKCHRISQDVRMTSDLLWLIRGHEGKTKLFVPVPSPTSNTNPGCNTKSHYTMRNFGRPCTQFWLTVASQDTMLPRLS